MLLNLLLATTFVWTRWLPEETESVGAAVLAAIWVLAWIEGRADWRRYLAELSREGAMDPQDESDQRYRQAVADYLGGNWVAAEQQLAKLLKRDARDAEACLLLATMWRRLQRPDDACQMLDRLERLETASPWKAEIETERRLLAGNFQPDERPIQPPQRTEEQYPEEPTEECTEERTRDPSEAIVENRDVATVQDIDDDRRLQQNRAA